MEKTTQQEASMATYRQNKTPKINDLIAEFRSLQASEELLAKVWDACGPYFDKPIPPDLHCKMQLHFNFDDSE